MSDTDLRAIEVRYALHESRHEDIPTLVAEVRRLNAIVDVARALADHAIECHNQNTQPR